MTLLDSTKLGMVWLLPTPPTIVLARSCNLSELHLGAQGKDGL